MALSSPRNFIVQRDGTTTIEFVVVFIGFIAIVLFVVEVTLYLFFVASLEKAAQAGVRAAVVSRPVVAGIPAIIEPADGASYGQSCRPDGDWPCKRFSAAPCTGEAECTAGNFNRILNHMRGFNGRIQPANVTVTYTDVGIGFAGGPTIPMVTVTVSCVPFDAGILGLLLGATDDTDCPTNDLARLPPRSASMTGEDLAQ